VYNKVFKNIPNTFDTCKRSEKIPRIKITYRNKKKCTTRLSKYMAHTKMHTC